MATLVFHHGDFDGAWEEDNNDITVALDNGHIYANSFENGRELNTKYGSVSSVIITDPSSTQSFTQSAFTTYLWTPSSSMVINLLLVGGGGGGGASIGGGGGAGEFVSKEGIDISSIEYTVIVGAGAKGVEMPFPGSFNEYMGTYTGLTTVAETETGGTSSFGVRDASINALGGGVGAGGNSSNQSFQFEIGGYISVENTKPLIAPNADGGEYSPPIVRGIVTRNAYTRQKAGSGGSSGGGSGDWGRVNESGFSSGTRIVGDGSGNVGGGPMQIFAAGGGGGAGGKGYGLGGQGEATSVPDPSRNYGKRQGENTKKYWPPPHGGDGLPYTINGKEYWFSGGGGGAVYGGALGGRAGGTQGIWTNEDAIYIAGNGGRGGGGGGSVLTITTDPTNNPFGVPGKGDRSSITFLSGELESKWKSTSRSAMDTFGNATTKAEGGDGISPTKWMLQPHWGGDLTGNPNRAPFPRGGNAAPHSGGGGGGGTYQRQYGGNGGSGIVVISSTGATEQGLTRTQQLQFIESIKTMLSAAVGVVIDGKYTFEPPSDLPNPTTAEQTASRIKGIRGEVSSDVVIKIKGENVGKVLGTDLDSTKTYIMPDPKRPYERAADEVVIVEVEENASWYHPIDSTNVIRITKMKNGDENTNSERRLTKGQWDISYNPTTSDPDNHFIAGASETTFTFKYDNTWYTHIFEGVSFIFKNPDGVQPTSDDSGDSCCYPLYRTCAPRTRICYAKNKPKPYVDLYCYWDEETPKNSIKRLNNPIKPNNTRDYGSKGAMNNTIRRRVQNKKDSCVSCTKSSGNCVYPRILGTRAAKGNLQNGAKSGQSGQATYWMNILPR